MAGTKKTVSAYGPQILVGVVLIALVYWLTTLDYKAEYKEIDRGYQGEALTNPFLAAEYFLIKMGQQAEKIKLFTEKEKVLGSNDTLLVPGNRIAYDQRRSEHLLNWVDQGGHLIVTGKAFKEDDYQSRDYILDPLGLYLTWQINEDEKLDEDNPVNINVADGEDFWKIDFVDYQVVSYADDFDQEVLWAVTNDKKLHAIQLKLGDGRLTLLSDTKMFRNDYIDEYDHAAFLFALSNDQAQVSDEGVFYYSLFEDQAGLLVWLWKNAKPLMISLLVMSIILLWMIVPRFGPLINVHLPVSRRFLDHLTASGNYHWRQGHYSRLIIEVRKQLSLQVKHKYPEWVNLSPKDQVEHFAEISQIESSAIEKALFDMEIERVDDFVQKIKILEKLRKSL